MLKRFISLILVGCLSFSLIGCTNQNEFNNTEVIEETEIGEEMPKLQIIAQDAQHKINIDTQDNIDTKNDDILLESEFEKNKAKKIVEDNSETFTSKEVKDEIAKKRELTDTQKNKILKQIGDFKVTNKESLNNLIKLIDDNIASFDLRERDLIIKKYILSLYDLMNNLNSILSVIGYDLEQVVMDYDIKVNDKTSIESIPNEYGTIKGFLLEVKDKGFFINSLNQNKDFYLDLDLGNVLTKYKEYISPSMNSYISFNNYEMNNTALLLDDSNNYNLDEIINRIKMLNDGLNLDKDNNYIMVDKYLSSLTYYYQLLLGLSHNQFIDVSNNNFDSNILEKYKTLQKKNKDSSIGDILEKTILAIEKNKMVYDDDLKSMINDYVNSIIYNDNIKKVLNTDANSKYTLLNKAKTSPKKAKTNKNQTNKKSNKTLKEKEER